MSSQHHHPEHEYHKSALHRHSKTILIVGIVLMLASMVIYVLTNDESIQPGKPIGSPVPEAAP